MKNKNTNNLIGNVIAYTLVCNLVAATFGFGRYLNSGSADADAEADCVRMDSSTAKMVFYDPALPRLPRDTCALRKILRDHTQNKSRKSKSLSDLSQILGRSQKHR